MGDASTTRLRWVKWRVDVSQFLIKKETDLRYSTGMRRLLITPYQRIDTYRQYPKDLLYRRMGACDSKIKWVDFVFFFAVSLCIYIKV